MNGFEFAAAGVAGRAHRLAGRNAQDAWHVLRAGDCAVAVVCDGCGSGARSEVGAQVGAVLAARVLARQAAGSPGEEPFPPGFWERARREMLARLRRIAEEMGGSLPATVRDYLLFTVVGALLTPRACAFFSIGDGVLVVNGEALLLGPYPGNAPPYLAYGLLEGLEPPRFHVQRTLPAGALDSFLLGTDGVRDLIERQDRPLPGRAGSFGSLEQLWREDRFFRNPDALRRRLEAMGREHVGVDRATGALRREPGLLPDDTTVVVGRRIARENGDGGDA